MRGCWRAQTGMGCRGAESGAPKATANILACCAVGAQSTTEITSAVPPTKIGKHPKPVDPPALIASFGLRTAVYSPSHSRLGFTASVYFPSHSTLYLSTVRLRL